VSSFLGLIFGEKMSGGSRPASQETRKKKDTPYESQHKQIKKIINQQSFRKLKDYL